MASGNLTHKNLGAVLKVTRKMREAPNVTLHLAADAKHTCFTLQSGLWLMQRMCRVLRDGTMLIVRAGDS